MNDIIKDNEETERELREFYIRVGRNVKNARQEKKLTQQELAMMHDFRSTSSISNPEIYYNEQHFSIGTLFKIAKVLEIELEVLLKC